MKNLFILLIVASLAVSLSAVEVEIGLSEGNVIDNPENLKENVQFIPYSIPEEIADIGEETEIDILQLRVSTPITREDKVVVLKIHPIISDSLFVGIPSWSDIIGNNSLAFESIVQQNDTLVIIDALPLKETVRSGNLVGFSVELDGASVNPEDTIGLKLFAKYLRR